MDEFLKEFSSKYLINKEPSKISHCHRCLSENWSDASIKKQLYEYELKGKSIFVCEKHIGCLEIAKEILTNHKPLNDIEKMKSKKMLDELILEGKKFS